MPRWPYFVYAVGGTITGGLFRMSNLAIWALMRAGLCRAEGCTVLSRDVFAPLCICR